MDNSILIGIIGALIGGGVGWYVGRMGVRHAGELGRAEASREHSTLEERLRGRDERIVALERDLIERTKRIDEMLTERSDLLSRMSGIEERLTAEKKAWAEKFALLDEARTKLSDAFKALSSEALDKSSRNFVEMAKATLETFHERAKGDLTQREKAIQSMVAPIQESLKKVDLQMGEIEKSRKEAYGSVTKHMEMLAETNEKLRSETSNLVTALRAPQVRGRWGEIQLKRVVEMAGMVNHCDFIEQESVDGEDGKLRPDMVVRLPGRKIVVVDSKAPLAAYLEAIEAKDEAQRDAKLRDHARQIRDHIGKLSKKAYWDSFESTPEFVVLFVPGEMFFSAALEKSPDLIEEGVKHRIILATPTTLIALLRAIAYGWQQETLAENAEEIKKLGQEMYDRIRGFIEHFERVGARLGGAVGAYNDAVGTLETRVLPAARKFPELGIPEKKAIPDLPPIDKATRNLQAPEKTLEPAEARVIAEQLTVDLRDS